MNITIILFILLAVLLIGALIWAVQPPKRKLVSIDDVLRALTEEHHYSRLPQILQALQPEDTAFLRARGFATLRRRIRSERGRIALLYLDCLQEEYEKLLEASRVVAAMAPEMVALDEAERFKLNLRFALGCRYLRWRLLLGLEPWRGFGRLSETTSGMALRLEMATSQIGERSALSLAFASILKKRDDGTQ
ncbi:MAG TPA: hypothetical protein VKA02_14565 [Candidatus Acidoferrum sp.]|nr:hypothetical protein [Candidatus Acidoferrum sp.]